MAKNPPAKQQDIQRPQSRQDSPDYAGGYLNDVPESSWLRGGGESAEQKPGCDHSQARLGRRGK
jgi:hypothetical protein